MTNWITYWYNTGSGCGGKKEHSPVEAQKVLLPVLLSFLTTREKWLMAFGLIMAALSGLAVPTWLVLLARGLDTFSNLAYLLDAAEEYDTMSQIMHELNKLVVSFAVLGGVSLITGSLYVSIWTYTGEKQDLRIKEKFVRSAFHQDAEWFDGHKREELPTKVANAMIHVNGAIGRQIYNLC